MTKVKALAGIVLYNPDIDRLRANIEAIIPQVDLLLLVENGSRDISYLEKFGISDDIVVINNGKNMGIAYALNQILGYAYSHGFDWALTLDQDSVVQENIISIYNKYIQDDVGIIGCRIVDRNFDIDESWVNGRSVVEVPWIITSASYTNTKVWRTIGGFDTQMFIDWVDTEYCVNLHRNGYRVLKVYETSLCHELGEYTSIRKVFGHDVYIINRPASRYYYVFRNMVYLGRKYPDTYSTKSQVKQFCLTLFGILYYEKHKCDNLFAAIKGCCAGHKMPIVRDSLIDDYFA